MRRRRSSQPHLYSNQHAPAPASPSSKAPASIVALVPASHSSSFCTFKQLTPADQLQFPPAAADICNHPSPLATTLLGLIQHFQVTSTYPPNNQGLNERGHRSSSLYNHCVHIFDRLQLRLQPHHTATPTICTKHLDDIVVTN